MPLAGIAVYLTATHSVIHKDFGKKCIKSYDSGGLEMKYFTCFQKGLAASIAAESIPDIHTNSQALLSFLNALASAASYFNDPKLEGKKKITSFAKEVVILFLACVKRMGR